MSQTKKSFTLDDLMWGGSNYWNIMPKNYQGRFWGDRLLHLDVDDVKQASDDKGRLTGDKVLFTSTAVNAAIDTAQVGKVYNLMDAVFPYADKPLALLTTSHLRFLYDWKAHKAVWQQHRQDESNADFQAASRQVAYVRDHNLYVRTADDRELTVTTDGSRELVYGQSVHREEFGINKGTFWSPQGTHLAFYRMDQSMVSDYPMVDIDYRVAQLAPEKYPMAGMTSHQVTIGIFTPSTGTTVYLQAGDPTDRYFTNIAWSPDEKTVYVFELPRTQDRADLVAYDAESGKRRGVLYTETNERYVEPMTPIRFLPWDDTQFIVESRRDGYNHLYLYDITGKQYAQLTKGAYEVTDVLGFNTKTHSVVYRSNAASPITYNLYAVSLSTGVITALDNGEGSHSAVLSRGTGSYLLDRWSAPTTFRRVDLDATDTPRRQRLHADDTPWKDYNVPEISSGSIKAADGVTDLYYRLVKPVDFDANKKYPAVVYVYGGPHAHNVEASWNYQTRPWEVYMAQRGYVVFVVDNRGSENRGFDFESCTHRHLGDIEMQDQMEGVKYLTSLPYVDANRLGVHGWSFGGFMTTNLMCSYPDVFKVGVAGGPVIDWKYYEVMYGERYMDTPEENPEGYASSSLLNKAKNLKGRLQIIVGYNDPTCVLQHSLSFLRACEDAGTQPDYFVYPGQGHNMMGRDMVHLHERITRYFDDYLK
jgi:dipeptidyl-peptidase-4